jgi:two-component system, OmpR family, response regulator MprA
MATILVVDDDPKITSALRRALAYEGYNVLVAADGTAALQQCRERLPDVVILDWMLPGMDGIAVLERLRAGGAPPVLMLTARDEVEDRVRGLDTGADDYLVKPFALDELLARVRALLRRQDATNAEVLQFADLVVNVASRDVRRGPRAITLSPREFDLLLYLLRHPRQVLTRERILDNVWGYDFVGDANVLDVYIGYVRQKLEAEGESRLIHTMRGVGYVLRD